MPQLIPFSFISSTLFLIITFSLIVYFFSLVILPLFPRVQVTRMFITKL